MDEKPEEIIIPKNRLFYTALAIAVINPIFGGLIMGWFLSRTPQARREGIIVTLFSLVWGVVVLMIALKYGALPTQP